MVRLILCLLCLAAPVRADWRDEILYFVMIDRFADGNPDNNGDVDLTDPLAFHGGDLAGITQRLDYIDDLGATALWITPVVQQAAPEQHDGKPFQGHHGYWAEDFTTLDPRFGTEDDLKALVDAAHERGIKVILDVVYNHVGKASHLVSDRPEWLRLGDQCGGDDVTRCLSGLPDLRTERPDVRDALFEAHLGLAERTGLDGFRLDTYKHVDAAFWADHRAAARSRLGDDFFLIGEIWDGDKFLAEGPFDSDSVDGILDFSFRDRTLKFLTGVEDPARYGQWFSNRSTTVAGHVLAPFLSNHNMPMLLAMLRGDTAKLRLGYALLMFAEGPPVIAWGEEQGRQGGPWPENRTDMDWSGGDSALRDDIAQLIALRQANPDMRSGSVNVLHAEGDVLALARGKTLLILNRGNQPAPIAFVPDGKWGLDYGNILSIDDAPSILPQSYIILRQP